MRVLLVAVPLCSLSYMDPVWSSEVPITLEILQGNLSVESQKRFDQAASARADVFDVIPDTEFKSVIGKGFDIFKGQVVNNPPCVEAIPGSDHDTLKEGLAPSYGQYWSDVVSGMTSNQSSTGTSVDFGITYKMISASIDSGSKSEHWFNSSDGYGRIYNRIVTRVQFRDGGKWSTPAQKDLKNNNLKSFVTRCATHYIQAIYSGHLIDETLWFELQSDKRTAESSDKLSFGVKGLLNLGTNDTSSSTTVKSLSVAHNDRGSRGLIAKQQAPAKDVDSIAALVDFGKYQFSTQVADADASKAALLLINVVPYTERSLPFVAKLPKWPDRIFALMQMKTSLSYDLITAVSDLRHAKQLDKTAYDALYSSPAYDKLQDRLNDATKLRDDYKDAIDRCRELMVAEKDNGGEAECKSKIAVTLDPAKINGVVLTRKHASTSP